MHSESNLSGLLDALGAAHRDAGQVSLGDLLDAVGHRAFGPVLVLPGLVVLSPAGGVPGMATAEGLISLFVAVQLLLGRESLWLPRWLLRRRMRRARFERVLHYARKPARLTDRLIRPRLRWAVRRPTLYVIALACALVALVTPALEFVPFADTVPAAALTVFGLALIARDGLCALLAAALCLGALAIGAGTLV